MKSVRPRFQISYSHKDMQAMKKVESLFKKYNINYFVDEKNIEPGEIILDSILDGIKRCTHLLVYLSPASVESQWVIAEIGMALALNNKIISLLDHPQLRVPHFLSNRKHMNSVRDLEKYLSHINSAIKESIISKMNAVERKAIESLYYCDNNFASAIRLFGADDEFITFGRLHVFYKHIPFKTPPEFLEERERFLAYKEREAKEKNQLFFNGPATRILSWRANPIEEIDKETERRVLELELGPVSWYDFEGLNEAFRKQVSESGNENIYEYYIGLSDLLENGDVSKSKLSNFLDTAITLVTSDGFAGYLQRSDRVACVPKRLTSAVAEGINRYLDDIDTNGNRVNKFIDIVENSSLGTDYIPKGIPHPFAAVSRGIEEELSPYLLDYITANAIKLTGLSFDLEALHPDALFVAIVNLTSSEVKEICRSSPGRDWFEGALRFTPATLLDPDTCAILADTTWIPAGKASFIRACELIASIQRRGYPNLLEAIKQLAQLE